MNAGDPAVFELESASIVGPEGAVLDGLGWQVRDHATTVVLGPGGTGKSLLMRALSGRPLPSGWAMDGRWSYRGTDLCTLDAVVRCAAETFLVEQPRRGDEETSSDRWREAVSSGVPTVLLDEPTVGLDPGAVLELSAALVEQRERGATVVVTHDVTFARAVADDVALMLDGNIQVTADAATFFQRPPNELAERFVRQGNCWPPGPRPPDLPSHFRWILPDRLAGMGRPGLLRTEEEDLEAIAAAGVDLVISLTTRPVPAERLRSYGLVGRHFPIQDMGVPPVSTTARLCKEIERTLERGERVAVHCHAGLGRTGTLLAAFLIWVGKEADEAIEQVRAVSPRYIQSRAQLTFIRTFAESV